MIRDDLERGEFGPHVAEHLMISGGLLVFALAYIVCMAPSVGDPTMRKMTQVIALVPPSWRTCLLKPASFADQDADPAFDFAVGGAAHRRSRGDCLQASISRQPRRIRRARSR